MPTFDIEYFFLNIRAKSTGEEIELMVKHPNNLNNKNEVCEHREKVKINIEEIKVQKSKNNINEFQLDDNVRIKMRYPTIESLATNNANDFDVFVKLIANCIETIYDKEDVYEAGDATEKELLGFVYSMNQKQISMVQDFFDTMPVLKHTVNYVCSQCGCKEKIEIEGFQNFFL